MDSIDRKVKALENFIERKERLKLTTPLRYLFWEATLRCNLSCLHCGSDCVRDNASAANEIGSDLIKRELRSIADHYPPRECTFAIIGGEPLLRPEILDVGAYAADLGFNWGITTNGMLMDRAMITCLKKANLKTISVSLDGTEADHDALRDRPGSHAIVTANVRNLLEDRFYKEFDVICCVSRINIDHLDRFVDELEEMGVPAIRFTPVFSRGRTGRNHTLMLGKSDYRKLLAFIAGSRAERKGIRIYLSEEGYWGPEWECVVRDEFHFCASGIQIGSILHDGRVMGCPSVSRKFIEGNIREMPFVEIWKDRFERYRGGRRQSFPRQCQDCEHWVLCEGGGFHLLDQEHTPQGFCCLEKIDKENGSNE
jgi:radical SAM protein with 4Fe4S-binding SPASM domain